MIRRLLAALLLWAVPISASAAPAFVSGQATNCGNTSPCTIAAGPTATNSQVAIMFALASTAGDTVSDSVGAFTSRHTTCAAANVLCATTFDRLTTGSPSTSITFTGTSIDTVFYWEVSGLAASGTNSWAGATGASGAQVATIAGVTNTDAQMGGGDATATVGSATTALSNNNAGSSTLGFGTPSARYGLATSTASSTFTLTPATSLTNPVVEYADYPAKAGAVGATGSFPDLGQVVFAGLVASFIKPLRPGMVCILRLDGGDECWRVAA